MKIKRNVCSKLWTDTNINFAKQSIKHCCKQLDNLISFTDIEELKSEVFNNDPATISDKDSMIVKNTIPDRCQYCKVHENNSIRHVWNTWSDEFIKTEGTSLIDMNFTEYFEFDIGKSCNLACIYCGPWSSTAWSKELNKTVIAGDIDQEWKAKILEQLAIYLTMIPINRKIVFNILGGEPLLINDTYDMIEYIALHCKHFSIKPIIMITSNLMVKPTSIKRLLNTIIHTKGIFEWNIAVSIEDINERAEKIRYNLNWKQFEENVKSIRGKVDIIYFTTTFNFFNYPYFDEFLDWVFDIMGYTTYGTRWDLTLNVVQGGFTDISYMDKDLVDHEKIKNAFLMHISKVRQTPLHTALDKKLDNNIMNFNQHIDNLYARSETTPITLQFIGWWHLLNSRRNDLYLNTYPLNKMIERFYIRNEDSSNDYI